MKAALVGVLAGIVFAGDSYAPAAKNARYSRRGKVMSLVRLLLLGTAIILVNARPAGASTVSFNATFDLSAPGVFSSTQILAGVQAMAFQDWRQRWSLWATKFR